MKLHRMFLATALLATFASPASAQERPLPWPPLDITLSATQRAAVEPVLHDLLRAHMTALRSAREAALAALGPEHQTQVQAILSGLRPPEGPAGARAGLPPGDDPLARAVAEIDAVLSGEEKARLTKLAIGVRSALENERRRALEKILPHLDADQQRRVRVAFEPSKNAPPVDPARLLIVPPHRPMDHPEPPGMEPPAR